MKKDEINFVIKKCKKKFIYNPEYKVFFIQKQDLVFQNSFFKTREIYL